MRPNVAYRRSLGHPSVVTLPSPLVDVDYTLGSLNPSDVFTRASSPGAGFYFDAAGAWQQAGTNVARFDHDPVTLAPLGVLIEAAATNLALWSRDLTNAVWTATNCTAAKTATGVDGSANAASVVTATGGSATIFQTLTAASTFRSFSAWVKRSVGTGTVSLTQDGGVTSKDITALINSTTWTRIYWNQTRLNPQFGFMLATSGDAIIVDGIQLEVSTVIQVPTSTIFTTTVAVVRAKDVLTRLVSTFGGYDASVGTLYIEWASPNPGIAAFAISMDDTTANNVFFVDTNLPNQASGTVTVGGVVQLTHIFTGGPASTTPQKFAIAYAASDVAMTFQGKSCSVAAVTGPTVTRISLGARQNGGNQLGGWVRRFKYFNTRLTNGQLQKLTQ